MKAHLLVLSSLELSLLCGGVHGTFDFFLSRDEVRKMDVVGWPDTFFYVDNGNVNHNTVAYNFQVPYEMNTLTFSWRARDYNNVTYSLSSHVLPGSEDKLRSLAFDVPATGRIPLREGQFRLNLRCAPEAAAAEMAPSPAEFVIQLDAVAAGKLTSVQLRRRKHCSEPSPFEADIVVMPRRDGIGSAATFYVGLGALVALMVGAVITGVAVAYCSRGWESTLRPSPASQYSSVNGIPPPPPPLSALPSASPAGSVGTLTSRPAGEPPSVPPPPPPGPPPAAPAPAPVLEPLDVDSLEVEEVLMEGTFGRICRGRLVKDEQDDLPVLVKLATEVASDTQVSVMLREAAAMTALAHPNLLSAMGVVEDGPESRRPRIVYMYYPSVNLKRFLHQCRSAGEGWSRTLLTQEVVHMAVQALNALSHLHQHSVVHKDVAARNCVVDDQLRVKLCDLALSRDLFPGDYHCLGDNENRPVKWLSLEALSERRFSPAADVWSFGVLFWELMTLGQQPYVEVDPFEMAAYLREGYRLAQPVNCPDELFAVMAYCWATEPSERPGLHHLQTCLIDFHMHLDNYV
ncbi:Tyrosine-protein kinase RYK [Amphibalanus amphitrite]|uniref:receptor protein-tyrosine kinase n=1 Tax=Amphibalanus amphitrite TaxID=1232801 RepID=A0A6A4VBQ0_AMPAM|nr:tyrosine-protein kinase RYK-like [Amphibalanus amphitrite]XP_043238452.1 tyrosine-protein kinase RYK-like [Amphibalanus amphitrite]XP_043238453.1 tyrosine-protein kinase RYK-like [Amphibalanus amphitrite]XP_043238454.1 tyrosine-protein kinase RYK-like [Amphibalanus amphitrite]XP_043238455.1 tyrosine-protein kinase RYK-like [Amphibalanus amphitrite]KAF0288700.1 Tyrosine-protein kinase RYK [Amphibalanus amphitrite]